MKSNKAGCIMLNLSKISNPISDQAMIWSLLGSESTYLAEMPSAEWRVQPPIRTAATPEDAHTTTEAVECHLRAKSTNVWMNLDLPVPPEPLRKSISWGVGIIFFNKSLMFAVRRAIWIDEFPELTQLAKATCCRRADPIKTKAMCCFSFSPQCRDCCWRVGKFGSNFAGWFVVIEKNN